MATLRSLVARARATERSRWWTTFLFTAALCSLWLLATPLFGAPDEPAHAIRAASVSRLEIVGEEVPRYEDQLVVDAPESYGIAAGEVSCFAFFRNVPASCAAFPDDSDIARVPTSAGRHPPAYYAVAGLPTLLFPDAMGVYLMRVISALLTAAFVASSVVTLERLKNPRIGALAVLLAATPMLFFVGGIVNPSAAEIPAALCVWIAGLVLVTEARQQVDARLVTRLGIAATVLVLSRQLAPLWLALIALALLAAGGRGVVRALWDNRLARRWGLVVVVATLAQLLWIAIVRPLDPSLGDSAAVRGLTTGSALRISFGETLNRLREMVGWFGWLDAPSPGFTYTVWTLAFGLLVAVALVLGRRRLIVIAGAVALVTIAAPIAFETVQAHEIGFFWQGRYSMPLAVGVPVLLAFAVAFDDPPARTREARFRIGWVVPAVAIAVGVGSIVAFGQALRRNTVGYDGPLDFPIDTIWSPPAPAWLLLIGYLVMTGAWVAWVASTGDRTPSAAGAPRAAAPA